MPQVTPPYADCLVGWGERELADLRIPEAIDVVQPTLAGRPRCHQGGR